MADTTVVDFLGWTTSATYYIKIYTPASERSATGIYDATKYRLEVAGNAIKISVGAGYFRIDGVQIQVTLASGTANGYGVLLDSALTAGDVQISKSIIKGVFSGTATNDAAINATALASGSATLKVWNTVIQDYVNAANNMFAIQGSTNWTVSAYNNTAYNCRFGFRQVAGTFIAINDVAMSASNGFDGTFDATSNYNASDIAADAPGANSQNGVAATFVNAAGGNFQPANTDTVARHNGTTDPGSGLFSDDITGAARSAPWDIGAFVAQADATTCKHALLLLGAGCN